MVAVVALVLWLLPSVVQAATYYVSTTGSNANDGLSEDTPKRNIANCVTPMVAGDTCYVHGGTYSTETTIRFAASGSSSAPIRLLAYPGELPVIDWPDQSTNSRILIQHASGVNVAMGYLTISGLELKNGYEGIKFHSLHNSTISNNSIHHNINQGILGIGGHHNLFTQNIIYHNGDFAGCAAGTQSCNLQHGMYMHGDSYTITHNVIYDNLTVGIQQNGSSSSTYSAARHPSPDFAGAKNWIVADNTVAYEANSAGLVVWGNGDNMRIENNIFYENRVSGTSSQAIFFTGNGGTGITIRNNHSYGSGSGGTAFIGTNGGATEGVNYTQTGNVVNVSAPAFVNGGSNSLPASPDFRLTASAPVNIALSNEFPNNSTAVVGAFKTVGTPTAVITANKITIALPMSTAVPIQNLSTTGVSVNCTGSACPGSPAVSSVSRAAGTDSQVEVTVAGITGNACESSNQTWTVSYSAATGSWTGNDNIGPYPGSHQAIFSFTNLAVTNQCDGTGPTGYPAGYHIFYKFNEGTGTNANDESANNLDCTLTNSAGWGSGKSGTALSVATGTQQYCDVPWGSGVNPSTQSLTLFIPIYIESGAENALHYIGGPDLGINQRAYVCGENGVWKVSIQSTSCQSTATSNLAVTAGWNILTLRFDSSTDIATLYKGTVAGTGGASVSYTSFMFASNFKIGKLATNTVKGNYLFDDFVVYLSLQDPADLVAVFNAPPPPPAGTLKQAAVGFGGVVLDTAKNPIVLGSLSHGISVPKRGGGVVLFEIKCNAGTPCDQTAFKLVYAKNGGSAWQQVPNTETADGTWMWGHSTEADLNNGSRATSLTGSCTMQTGATLVTADQVPSLALAADTCTVLAYIVHVDGVAGVDYFDYKMRTQDNVDLAGGYDEIARIRVVNPMGGGAGY